jgi:hypothetical protein
MRRVTPIKDPQSYAENQYNQVIAKYRIPVEWFFGRIINSFAVFHNIYRWSHKHFNYDFAIACCLTNEHIQQNRLNENDHKIYLGLLSQRIKTAEVKETKRKQQQDAYRARKRRQLSGESSEHAFFIE